MATKRNPFEDMEDDLDALKDGAVKVADETRSALAERGVELSEEAVRAEITEKTMVKNWLAAGNKLEKGMPLSHAIFGTVVYRSKVRHGKNSKNDFIIVEQQTGQNMFGAGPTGANAKLGTGVATFKVKTTETFVMPQPKLAKKQTARLLLARCELCNLRIRASNAVFMLGTPLCFNDGCEQKGKPLTIEGGTLGQDMGEVWREAQREHQIQKPKRGK